MLIVPLILLGLGCALFLSDIPVWVRALGLSWMIAGAIQYLKEYKR